MYNKDIECWEKTYSITQDGNGITSNTSADELLNIKVQTVPGYDSPNNKFIILTTDSWSIDYGDLEKFSEYLKSLCRD